MRVRLQFSAQKTIGSMLIRWWTWSDYSHVDFILPDGRLLGARHDGVNIRDPYETTRKLIVEVDAGEFVLNTAYKQIGKPYDWTAIFGFMVKRDWQEPDAWFCSELVAWAFEQTGISLIRSDGLYKISPRDLLLSPLLKESR